MSSQLVWFVTGISSGIGKELVEKLLVAGQKVAGTTRKSSSINIPENPNFLLIECDLKTEAGIVSALAATVQKFGRLDVVVNNAAFVTFGTNEEISDKELRDLMEINFFAPMTVNRVALGYLRPQRSGLIYNISSMAGFTPVKCWGTYNAAKFALSGVTESLSQEVSEFGVRVCSVNPGFFRTPIHDTHPHSEKTIEEYNSKKFILDLYKDRDTRPFGSTAKLCDLMIELALDPNSKIPLQLFTGVDAYEWVKARMDRMVKDMSDNEHRTTTTLLE
ncbi:hypothetical protein CYY_010069 [Polysphondylium violaceum]|uniref:Short-chain dehydrogenase/reductase family protein n=1 Tax=Polysphondylium violaceum TaxID=133409 RepID=A0A8J4PSD6_9MYCE|nr:hypothetical protein CYY_010069 [Polysphondylium violaceum]